MVSAYRASCYHCRASGGTHPLPVSLLLEAVWRPAADGRRLPSREDGSSHGIRMCGLWLCTRRWMTRWSTRGSNLRANRIFLPCHRCSCACVSTVFRIVSLGQMASVLLHSSEMVPHMAGPAALNSVGSRCSLEMYVYLKKWNSRNACGEVMAYSTKGRASTFTGQLPTLYQCSVTVSVSALARRMVRLRNSGCLLQKGRHACLMRCVLRRLASISERVWRRKEVPGCCWSRARRSRTPRSGSDCPHMRT
mmetsp:Transcript_43999/g.111303  ORF Transcript_43999/g.111303 Transcript_43999/m.111303 type:complete len:250 (+) Transcript_43999:491-1240(+)